MRYRMFVLRSMSIGLLLIAVISAACGGAPSAQAPSPAPSGTASATASAGASAGATSSAAASGSPAASSSPASGSATPASPASSPASGASPSGSLPPTPTPVASGPFAGYIFVPSATGSPPDNFTRYGGTVVDAQSGDPVVGACVYTGPPAGCPPKGALQTDEHGGFAIDLPSGSDWAFTVEIPRYQPAVEMALDRRTDNTVKLVPR